MAIDTSNYITESVLFIRDKLRTNITDPKGRSGAAWIHTAFPTEGTPSYPLIVVRKTGGGPSMRLGHQSQGQWCPVTIEIRVYAKKVSTRDQITQDIHNYLRSTQIGSGSTTEFEMFDFMLNSSIPIDEPGEDGLHSEVMECVYNVIMM